MLHPPDEIDALCDALQRAGLTSLATPLCDISARIYRDVAHGDLSTWRRIIAQLPTLHASSNDFAADAVRIGEVGDCASTARMQLKRALLQLAPWRKGPFDLFGLHINAEWRANRKWARLGAQLSLRDKCVLDVGCGNGYYLWRMLGAGARLALGIDPTQLFIAQFYALKKYCVDAPAFITPLRAEQFPRATAGEFDCVFSMGVLSHRRNPRAHLDELLGMVRADGDLIIETLVIDGDVNAALTPANRYAKMRNVHLLPSTLMLERWLHQAGATDVRLLHVGNTDFDEQRVTEWMQFESLADFLHPDDSRKTIEGHPAPQRAMFLCGGR